MTLNIYHTLRGNKNYSKGYITNLIETFAEAYVEKQNHNKRDIVSIDICKQHMRGCLSISLRDKNGCISNQRFFLNQSECVNFMEGFVFACNGY